MAQISNEYASALYSLAEETRQEDAILRALKSVKEVFQSDSAIIEFLSAPSIPLSVRENALKQAFEGKIPEYALSFLQMLLQRGRIRESFACMEDYAAIYDKRHGLTTATVVSAVTLSEDEKTKLTRKLEAMSGQKVRLNCQTDETLLGGLVVTLNGKVLDGSLLHRLNQMKEVMDR